MKAAVITLSVIICIVAITIIIYAGVEHIRSYLNRVYDVGFREGYQQLKNELIAECNKKEIIKFVDDYKMKGQKKNG